MWIRTVIAAFAKSAFLQVLDCRRVSVGLCLEVLGGVHTSMRACWFADYC